MLKHLNIESFFCITHFKKLPFVLIHIVTSSLFYIQEKERKLSRKSLLLRNKSLNFDKRKNSDFKYYLRWKEKKKKDLKRLKFTRLYRARENHEN